jgi:hypothetical protein
VLQYYSNYLCSSADFSLEPSQQMDFGEDEGSVDIARDIIDVPYDATRVDALLREYPQNSKAFAEWAAAYEVAGNELPRYRSLIVHGAVVEFRNKAYLFTAPSGTGKSTHIALWKYYLGDAVTVINGDKPIIRIGDTHDRPSSVRAYGSPWAGKEGLQTKPSADLAGICLLRRGGGADIHTVGASAVVTEMINRVFLPQSSQGVAQVLELLDVMLQRVPLYELSCDISEKAVRSSFETMTGYRYDDCRPDIECCE